MSDAKGANNDPSMDDILASIRKIISDDEARAQARGAAAASAPRSDDVLLLTDLVEEPASAGPPRDQVPPARIDPVKAAEMPQPSIVPPPPPAAAPPIVPPAAAPPAVSSIAPVEVPVSKPSEPTLVEPGAAGDAVAAAFDRLNQAVQDSVPPPSAHDRGPTVGSSDRSLEDIVKDLLRPMLKEWLDKNLPGMVERFVEREIVRLTRR